MDSLTLDTQLGSVQHFLGAYPFDLLPSKPHTIDFSLVINTDKSTLPGDHWLVLLRKDSTVYFIDSYGRNYNDFTFEKDFTNTVKKYVGDEKIHHNKIWLQRLTSNVCGMYCVYFVRELVEHNLGSCLAMFSDNLAKNDQYVLNYLNSI